MKALKAAVILMGVGLVVGFGALFVMWAERHASPEGAVVVPAGKEADVAVMPIPPGGRVVQVAPGNKWVDVLVENPDGTRDLIRVRRADGTVAGTLRFRPSGP